MAPESNPDRAVAGSRSGRSERREPTSAAPAIRPIRRILVANRGEIARRVIRTAHRMGLQAVAIHSDPDAGAPFVRDADLAVAIGGRTSAESYLVAEKVLDAARRSGADAIHPGYGFLSENPVFAAGRGRCRPGLDRPDTRVDERHGAQGRGQAARGRGRACRWCRCGARRPTPATPTSSRPARRSGFPLLVKASAGGGGKGMRLVREPDGPARGGLRRAQRGGVGVR